MDIFNLKEYAEQSLRLLERNGASAKMVKEYRTTGFGAFIRHFTRRGVADVNDEMLDAFVLEQREHFERGEFSEWKWRLVRRGSELLKHFAQTGTVDLTELRPWDPVLRKPRQSVELDLPTPEQLADPDDLFALIWRVKQALLKAGLTKRTVRHYTVEGMTVILRRHIEQGLVRYCESLTAEMVAEIRHKYEQGFTSRVSYQNLRKASFFLAEMHRTGDITFCKIPDWGQREPAPEFAALLLHFCDNTTRTGILAGSTVKTARSAIRTFFFELEARGRKSFDGITLAEISDTITRMADRYMVLRSFFDYAGELDCTQIALSVTVQNIPIKAPQSKVVEYLSETALEVLLKQPDPTKRTGLRNLFFMVLMYDTAARCGELLDMKVRDLRIKVQHPIAYLHGKGSKTRTVPLLAGTVQHCERYLRTFHTNEPADSEKPLFYTVIHGIQQPMSADTVALFLKKYGDLACHACPEVPSHIHAHMLRHTRAMHLYRQGMPMMLLSEYLGHASEETTKVYAYADTEMKRAAIDKADIVRGNAPPSVPVWINDDEMILKLSGLI